MIWICDHENILVVLLLLSKSNLGPSQALMMDFFTLREKCPYSGLFWSVFSSIRSISPYSVRMRENTDQNNFEYGHFFMQC